MPKDQSSSTIIAMARRRIEASWQGQKVIADILSSSHDAIQRGYDVLDRVDRMHATYPWLHLWPFHPAAERPR